MSIHSFEKDKKQVPCCTWLVKKLSHCLVFLEFVLAWGVLWLLFDGSLSNSINSNIKSMCRMFSHWFAGLLLVFKLSVTFSTLTSLNTYCITSKLCSCMRSLNTCQGENLFVIVWFVHCNFMVLRFFIFNVISLHLDQFLHLPRTHLLFVSSCSQ